MGGFQFDVSGVSVLNGAGGAAADAGFEISASGATVLGFAFDGSVVPAGTGVLTNLEIVITDAALSACLSDVVLSDNDGDQITADVGGCITCLLYTSPSPRD